MSTPTTLRVIMSALLIVSIALLANDLYRTFEVNPLAYHSPIPRFILPLVGFVYVWVCRLYFVAPSAHSSARSSDESTRRNSIIETYFDGH